MNIKQKVAPICLFVYNRLNVTIKTITDLQNNYMAFQSDLFIFSDAAKNQEENKKVKEVREFIKHVRGFNSVTIVLNGTNLGLAKSVVTGVSKIINKYGRVIVVEDDLRTSTNFLNFMNQALNFYYAHDKIHSVSGYTMPLKNLQHHNQDFYLSLRASSWGWATWDYIWNDIDWEVSDYHSFRRDRIKKRSFNKGGSDLSSMLRKNRLNKIDSWAIIFCYDQWKKTKLTIYPTISKVVNLGFNNEASNTKFEVPEYRTYLDKSKKKKFIFKKEIMIDKRIIKSFSFNYSYWVRIKNKLLNF